jgi:hypothetical protein
MSKNLPSKETNFFDSDYNFSKETYYSLIRKGQQGIEEMLEVAAASEHPRAYEVLSKLIKDVSDVNDRLMDLNKKKKDLENADKKHTENTTNNVFIGSTTELQRLLHREKLGIKDITPKESDESL